MRIYFAGSISAGRDDVQLYAELIKHLAKHGTVLTEHVGDSKIDVRGEHTLTAKHVHDRDIKWLLSADMLVAEVTTLSLGIGYEIGRAVEHGIPVLALYRPGTRRLSPMVAGAPGVKAAEYSTPEEAKAAIDGFFPKRKLMTLCLIRKGDDLLLGMKKRGFGEGRWNGFGGKVKPDETIEEAAKRELFEEVSVKPLDMRKRGVITFHFEGKPEALEVHIFGITKFSGEPVEGEEMRPQWYSSKELPFEHMWPDDRIWMPLFLSGKNFSGDVFFKDADTIIRHTIKEEKEE